MSAALEFCAEDERGNWEALGRRFASQDEPEIVNLYIQALEWATGTMRTVAKPA